MATVPFLYDMGARHGWFTEAQLADMIAVADSTPGPIGVNMATYVGYTTAGFFGSLLATFSLVLPSVIIILIVAKVLQAFKENFYVKSAFYALRPASTGLIAAAGCTVAAISILNLPLFKETGNITDIISLPSLILCAVLLVLTNIKPLKKLHPVAFIALSAIVGIVFKFGA